MTTLELLLCTSTAVITQVDAPDAFYPCLSELAIPIY